MNPGLDLNNHAVFSNQIYFNGIIDPIDKSKGVRQLFLLWASWA